MSGEQNVEKARFDREALGRLVREVWMEWAREQPEPKPSWLVPWDGLPEPDREVDRRIGEAVARRALAGEVIPQGTTVTEWAVRRPSGAVDLAGTKPDGSVGRFTEDECRYIAARTGWPLLSRQHTTYAETVTDWQEATEEACPACAAGDYCSCHHRRCPDCGTSGPHSCRTELKRMAD